MLTCFPKEISEGEDGLRTEGEGGKGGGRKAKVSNQTHVSSTDPEAGIVARPKEGLMIAYKGHFTVDSSRVVTALEVTPAQVEDSAEWIIAEAKTLHGLRRAFFRGLEKVRMQGLLTASVQNIKRLLKYWKDRIKQTAVNIHTSLHQKSTSGMKGLQTLPSSPLSQNRCVKQQPQNGLDRNFQFPIFNLQ